MLALNCLPLKTHRLHWSHLHLVTIEGLPSSCSTKFTACDRDGHLVFLPIIYPNRPCKDFLILLVPPGCQWFFKNVIIRAYPGGANFLQTVCQKSTWLASACQWSACIILHCLLFVGCVLIYCFSVCVVTKVCKQDIFKTFSSEVWSMCCCKRDRKKDHLMLVFACMQTKNHTH